LVRIVNMLATWVTQTTEITAAAGDHGRSIDGVRFPARTAETHELEPIYFGANSAALDVTARRTLVNVIHRFANTPEFEKHSLLILSQGSNLYGDRHNFSLWERRARVVRDYLEENGIPADRFPMASFDNGMPPMGTSEAADRPDRKVEIVALPPKE
jgi:outer membrane protein OmpA-like peptidoglycan-associated protein